MAMTQNSWLNKIYRETFSSESHIHERRSQQRILVSTPATVTSGQHTIAASMKDISSGGLFCVTDARFEPGCKITIVLALPEGAGLPLAGMVCCHGRVVRVSYCSGQYGIAAEIERMADASEASFPDASTGTVPHATRPWSLRTPQHPSLFWLASRSGIE